MGERTTQKPFGNNKMCRFHIGQVSSGRSRRADLSERAGDTFAYRNPSRKPFGYPRVKELDNTSKGIELASAIHQTLELSWHTIVKDPYS